MKFKNVLIFFSLSFCYIPLHAHNFCEEAFYNFPDSISQITGSQETKHPTAKESFKRNFSYMGIPFITAGLIVKERNTDFRTLRNRFKPAFHHRYDDYTQYVPLAATWGMKLAGVQSRSSWKELAVSNLFSAALMAGFVNSLKYTPEKPVRTIHPTTHFLQDIRPQLSCVPPFFTRNMA